MKPRDVGSPPRYKPDQQKIGLDFDKIFTVKMASIWMVLSIATRTDLQVEQLDVKTTFLHDDLKEEIYMQLSEGFIKKQKENLVCWLKKSLDG